MKFDKEKLLKHHFWIGVALAIPLPIVCLLLLSTQVSGLIDSARVKIETQLKKPPPATVSPEQIDKKLKVVEFVSSRNANVWQEAYAKQEKDFTWPDEMEKKFHYSDGFFAYEVKATHKKEAQQVPKEGEPKGGTAAPKAEAKDAPPAAAPVPAEAAPPETPNVAQGTLVSIKPDLLIVKTSKNPETTFFRTVEMKIFVEDKDTTYDQLREGDQVTIKYYVSRYFYDAMTLPERELYAVPGVYSSQIDAILSQVQPADDKGQGVVQFKGWTYKKGTLPPPGAPFFHYVAGQWNTNRDLYQFSEDAWLAQEDLWIQKEIFRLVRQANDYVSKFKPRAPITPELVASAFGWAGSPLPGPLFAASLFTPDKSKTKTYLFENPSLLLEMSLSPSGNEISIQATNKLPRRQGLDVDFLVQCNPDPNVPKDLVKLQGKPLEPKETSEVITRSLSNTQRRQAIFAVDQILSTDNAAVKRIDQIAYGAGAHSHFTVVQGTRAYRQAGAGGAAPAPPPAPGPGGPAPAQPGDPGAPGAAAAAAAPDLIIRSRYLPDLTEQVRHIPVAITLIVDQEHYDRVMTSFENSKFRFETKQAWLNHYPFPLLQQAGPAGPQPVAPMPDPVPAPGPGQQDNVFGGQPGQPGQVIEGQQDLNPTPTPRSTGQVDELATNWELTIYGIITIYERFPPKPADAPKSKVGEAAGGGPAPGAAAAPQLAG